MQDLTTLLFEINDIPLRDLQQLRQSRIEIIPHLPTATPDQRYTKQVAKLHLSILDDLINIRLKYDRMGYIMARHRVDSTYDGFNPTQPDNTIPF